MGSSCKDGSAYEQVEAQTHLYRLIFNYMTSMAVNCATQLGIPDKINSHGKPITLLELASALDLHPRRTGELRQIMRLLVFEGLFSNSKINEEEAYSLTPTSRLLLRNTTPSFSGFVGLHLHIVLLKAFLSMGDWFLSENPTAFDTAHGMGPFEFVSITPDYLSNFTEAMASDSNVFNSSVLGECMPVFEGLDSLVDVAGGTGALATAISQACPQLKCIVLDLPNVVANLSGTENLHFVGGDMFKAIPPADAVLLKCVLHNWSDEDCVTILKNCKASTSQRGKRGKVVIIDTVINEDITGDEDESTKVKLYSDVLMMAIFNGKERTEKEWQSLFIEAGFSRYKIKPLRGCRSLIEVFP